MEHPTKKMNIKKHSQQQTIKGRKHHRFSKTQWIWEISKNLKGFQLKTQRLNMDRLKLIDVQFSKLQVDCDAGKLVTSACSNIPPKTTDPTINWPKTKIHCPSSVWVICSWLSMHARHRQLQLDSGIFPHHFVTEKEVTSQKKGGTSPTLKPTQVGLAQICHDWNPYLESFSGLAGDKNHHWFRKPSNVVR